MHCSDLRCYLPKLYSLVALLYFRKNPFWNVGNMQDSPAAIMQASNLYLYTMHNPVMWQDPSGMNATLVRDVLNSMPSNAAPNTPAAARAAEERIAAVVAAQAAYRAQSSGSPSSSPSGSYSTGLNMSSSVFYDIVERQVVASSGGMSHWTDDVTRRSEEFLSKQNAILAWSLIFHPRSRDREYGAWIYRNTDGSYQIRRTYTGGATEVYISQPRRGNEVAWIHTHPHAPNAEFFSGGDGNFSARHGYPGFLVAPSGTISRIDPSFPYGSHGYLYQGVWRNHTHVPHDFMYNDMQMVTVFMEDIFNRRRRF